MRQMSESGTCCVVVTYNSAPVLTDCLRSLREQQVIVVDNNSSDGSGAVAESAAGDVRVLRNDVNRGFAAAANQGILAAGRADVMLVNPDVVVAPGTVQRLAVTASRTAAGLVAPRLLYPDGRAQASARTFPTLPQLLARRTRLGTTQVGARLLGERLSPSAAAGTRNVDWVIGAVMYLRRKALDVIGGFDEHFFLYGEDVDICARLWRAGFPVVLDDLCTATHAYGRASRRTLDFRRPETRHHWASIVRLARTYPRQFFLGRPIT